MEAEAWVMAETHIKSSLLLFSLVPAPSLDMLL